MNTWNSSGGDVHIHWEAGLEYFTIVVPAITSIIHASITSEKGMKQHKDEENQIRWIHIAIKSK